MGHIYCNNKGFIIQVVLLITSIIAYIVLPTKMDFSMSLYYATFSISIVSFFLYFKYKNKSNYFDFDTIFIVVCYLIFYFSPFFYDEPYYLYLFLGYEFDESYINSASILATIGMISYYCGSLYGSESLLQKERKVSVHKFYSTRFLSLLLIVLVVLFVIVGGFDAYRFMYADEGEAGDGIHTYILLLSIVLSIIIITIEIHKKCILPNYRIKIFPFIVILGFSLLLLLIGNRTAFSQLVLPVFGLYFMYIRNINVKKMLLIVLVGIVSMWVIQKTRKNEDISMDGLNIAYILTDMTIPSRQTYVAMEYVDKNSITYGKSMSLGLIGVIPKLASFFESSINERGSAELLTAFTYDNLNRNYNKYTGLGTTIIADIYLSFGFLGIIVLMFLFGHFINVQYQKAYEFNIYSMIIVASLLANSIFLPRASITHFVRYMVWAIGLFYIITKTYEKNRVLHSKS